MCQDCYDMERELEQEIANTTVTMDIDAFIKMKQKIKHQRKELKSLNRAMLVKNAQLQSVLKANNWWQKKYAEDIIHG
jgi:hypothetical protein